jgi:hypothetical protein
MVAAAIVGAGLGGAMISSQASRGAAKTQSDAANRATDLQQQNLQQTRESLQPFINTGYDAQGMLRNLIGIGAPANGDTYGSLMKPFGAAEFEQWKDPGYDFQLKTGQQALQNSQAAKDGVLSGGALKDMIGFNQGMASNAYQNAYSRYMGTNEATYKRLADLLGVGENAAAGVGNVGVQASSGMANTITSGANALAAGQIGSANAWNGSLNNMGSMYMLNKMTGGNIFQGDQITSGPFTGSHMATFADGMWGGV